MDASVSVSGLASLDAGMLPLQDRLEALLSNEDASDVTFIVVYIVDARA